MFIKILNKKKEILDFSNYSFKQKFYHGFSKLGVCKMKDKTTGVAIKVFVWLKPNMRSFLVGDSSEHKNAKGACKNVV